MNINQVEEIKYCAHCGSANKKSAVICAECEKKIRSSHKPFYDFLEKHTKDEIKGKITDSLFSHIKEFLLSHLYGVALSVTVIATTVSAVYTAEPHIEKVTQVKSAPVAVQTVVAQQEDIPEAAPLNEDDLYSFLSLMSNYDGFADRLRESDSYWDTEDLYYDTAGDMYAENNIEGYSYRGAHELISNPISMHMLDVDPAFTDEEYRNIYSDRYTDNNSAVYGEQCSSEFAKTLLSEGYRVAECNYVMCEAEGTYDYDSHTGNVVKKLVYKVVFVEHDGEWYIAEDRLIERVNV